ncbi:MAG: ABC transporter substrate-binding protein [Lachnospiraceae bacterium]
MKKKVVSILLAAAMAATLLAGCGSSNSGSADTSTAAATEGDSSSTDTGSGEKMSVYLVSKGFQHQYWQAVYQGAQEAAEELGVDMTMEGPNTESDIQQQVQMLNNAINLKPDAIGLAALDTQACLEAINTAMSQGIPIIGFDSGVPDAPEGAVKANAATDNYAAGELAAEETYKLISEKIKSADSAVRIGVMAQDATAESIVNRGLGFIDKIIELIEADGKTVGVEGNDKYTEGKDSTDGKDVIIDVAVPAQVTAEASTIDGQNLLNKADTICIYASNQHSGEALVHANDNLKKLGDDGVIGVAFDSGTVIKTAVKDGTLAGAVTQDPLSIGRKTVELAVAAAKGETVEDVDTGCQWYTADNMDDAEIAPNLYD